MTPLPPDAPLTDEQIAEALELRDSPNPLTDSQFVTLMRCGAQALRELKALRTQLAHLAESAGDDSCADFARKLNAERDALRARLAEAERGRDGAREEADAAEQARAVAEDSCKWDVGFREGQDDAAEQIATWLDDHHGGRDDDPHNVVTDAVSDIRSGQWRAKEGT